MRRGTWRPLLAGTVARKARTAIEEIASAIDKPRAGLPRTGGGGPKQVSMREASLAGGTAGLAVFYAYLDQSGFGSGAERKARRFLQEAGDAVESVRMGPSLYSGFAGIAWAMAHLEPRIGETFSTEAVDEALAALVNRGPWKADYDLIVGLVGMGVYALERLPAAAAVSCLEGVVDRLGEISEKRSGGITWHTGPELLPPQQLKECPRGYDNLGLAHGVPGVIALLGAAWAAGVKRRKARKLLEGAVAWLLEQERRGKKGSRFSAWTAPGARSEDCRTAWCYGDAGVAVALFEAARCVGKADWEKKALEIAIAAASRPPEQAGAVDAGLCHGAAGIAHIFNRMYQATGDATLGGAARYWLERTLAMRRPGRGVGGFSALAAKDDGTRYWDDDPGILTGAAGIGLALLAATTSIEPEWDRMLLVSTPDRRSGMERAREWAVLA